MKIDRAVKRFGKALQEVRKNRQLSIEAMALELGIDGAYLSRIERGQKNISLSTASRLAEALSLEIKLGDYKLTK